MDFNYTEVQFCARGHGDYTVDSIQFIDCNFAVLPLTVKP